MNYKGYLLDTNECEIFSGQKIEQGSNEIGFLDDQRYSCGSYESNRYEKQHFLQKGKGIRIDNQTTTFVKLD